MLNKPIAAVSLLEVCVFASGAHGKIMAALDAGRSDVYVGEYEIPAVPGQVPREHILTRSEFLAQAKGWTVVTPDSVLSEAAGAAGLSVSTLPPISAAEVARLGWRKIQSGETVTPEQLEANYIRRTDAEMLEKSRFLALRVRRANHADVPAMMELDRQSPAAAHWSRQQYEGLFVDADRQWAVRDVVALVVEDEGEGSGRILAFLVAHQIDTEWELENIVVAAAVRRDAAWARRC